MQCFPEEHGKQSIILEVDRNIALDNGAKLRKCGAGIFVAGSSSVFRGPVKDYFQNIRLFRKAIK